MRRSFALTASYRLAFVGALGVTALATRVVFGVTDADASRDVPSEAPAFQPAPLIDPQPASAPALGLSDSLPGDVIPSEGGGPDDALSDEEIAPPEVPSELLDQLRAGHPWARFERGAWRRVRVITESFDAAGDFAGRTNTERVERLEATDDRSYTLQSENRVAFAGRPAPGAAETQRLWLLTDRPTDLGVPAAIEEEPTSISLGEVVVSCQTWRVTTEFEGALADERICVAPERVPSVLRRQLVSTSGEGPGTIQTQAVTRLDLPAIYGEELTRSWHVSTTITQPDGSRTERSAVYSADAPGGLHWEATSVYDSQGRRTHWSVAELVESGRTPIERIEVSEATGLPEVAIEVRPRRFMRLLRREERRDEDAPAEQP
ncbi:hypothetical protein [Botrimarina colliarenosi]|nr:hypothetical protein [Botrimarina colliarenosi]